MQFDPTNDSQAPVGITAAGKRNILGGKFQMLDFLARILLTLMGIYRAVAVATATFTRPADTTAYASGDLVANSTTAGSVVPITLVVSRQNGGNGIIRRVRLAKSGTSVTNASFRVHLYKDSPTPTNGDNGVWLTTTSTWIGSFDVTVDKVFSDGAKGVGAPTTGSEVNFDVNSGVANLYALVEARGAYTPASAEVFIVAAEIQQF